MLRAVKLQALLTALVAVAAWVLGGPRAAASAALGGAACVLPNAGFALWLQARRAAPADGLTPLEQQSQASRQVVFFFVGEFAKVLATVALILLVALTFKGLVWMALIVAVIAVLQGYLLALMLR